MCFHVLSSRPLNVFKDGAKTTSSGKLFHKFTTRILKKFDLSLPLHCSFNSLYNMHDPWSLFQLKGAASLHCQICICLSNIYVPLLHLLDIFCRPVTAYPTALVSSYEYPPSLSASLLNLGYQITIPFSSSGRTREVNNRLSLHNVPYHPLFISFTKSKMLAFCSVLKCVGSLTCWYKKPSCMQVRNRL